MKPSSSSTTSLWLDRPEPVADEPLPQGIRLDDVVVGAGITGLTTALLLARAGRRVVVLEAGVVGSLASGNTTAKVSLLQGTKYSRMLRYQSKHVARAYVEGNLEGQQWMLRFCDDHEVPFQLRDAVTYASSPDQQSTLDDELQASRAVGLDTHAVRELDVPFPHFGGIVLPDQVQLDPMDLLVALVEQIRAHGGSVHQGQRVVDVSKKGDRRSVTLEGGTTVEAEHVVLATGTPILDRGLYFAKLEPMRSYVLAFDAPESTIPDGMFLSAGTPSRSVRDAPTRYGRKLLVGGSGHPVGRTSSEREHVEELRAWTVEHFQGAGETHAWSAQDYRSHDSVPYIGPLPRGGGKIFVATGFDKWGMASGVMAGRSISAQILDQAPSWQRTMSHRITRPSGVAHLASINAKVGLALAVSAVDAERRPEPDRPAEGRGAVGRRGVVPVGVSTTDGTTCAVRAICTHLGGVLAWNDNERSWDCPLHGSRFSADGTVIEGPAVRPLKRLDPSTEQEPS